MLEPNLTIKKRATTWLRIDAVTSLTIYIVLLYCIPSDRRISALGGAGSLATLFAILLLLWWCWHHLQRPDPWSSTRFQPVRTAGFVFAGVALASYSTSSQMALPGTDASVADMGLIRVAGLVGILLISNDGIRDEARFLTLIRRFCVLIGVYALLGLVQFFTETSYVDAIQIPGLASTGVSGVELRGGFARADATAMHPLEYAAVMALVLPFCLALAIYDKKSSALVRWFPVAAITFSTILSVTRSALIGVLAVFVVMFPTWPRKIRRLMGAGIIGCGLLVYFLVPGMGGVISTMFFGEDTSVESRVDGYDTVVAFSFVSPYFGRGFGTFLPSYRILDNQYLVSLIDTGFIGLFALVSIIFTAAYCGLRGRVQTIQQPLQAVGIAFLASMIAGGLIFAFFDAFAFPQACNTLFLIAGLAGSYLNIVSKSKELN